MSSYSIALIAAALLSTAASAEDPVIVYAQPVDAASERVSYASLDLATAKGLKTLNFRVAGAIERVCDKDVGRDGLQDRGYYACESSAWTGARRQIDAAVLRHKRYALGGGSIVVRAG